MFRADTFKIFMTIKPDQEDCEDCPFLEKTIEEYEIWGCKDREVEVNCSGTHLDCFRVQEIEQDIHAFIEDNQAVFEFITEVK
jgi:hypothetical protein